MLVTQKNFTDAINEIREAAKLDPILGYDTETFCLPWWRNHHYAAQGIFPGVFSIQVATYHKAYYFDFHHSQGHLFQEHFRKISHFLTEDPDITWAIHNAKFDLHQSLNHTVEFKGTVHCTQAIARVVNNLEPICNLDTLSEKYLGAGKIDVIKILKERKHFTMVKKWGRNEEFDEVLHFDRLTLSELVDYGCRDASLARLLALYQIKEIEKQSAEKFSTGNTSRSYTLNDVYQNELKLTKVLFEMEREGIKIDREYCESAYNWTVHEYTKIQVALDQEALNAGIEGKINWASSTQLKKVFEVFKIPCGTTEKGNTSFKAEVLEDIDHILVKYILKYRYHYKRAHTYFENFIWFADDKDVIHASIQQSGTQFGRMSSWDPNLYNIPKRKDKEESNYKVRSCFIPKKDTIFYDADYKGAEYVMAIDYAKEMPVVEMIKSGVDPHAKLGLDMELASRDSAKTMQFRVLYGAGGEAIGKSLGYKGSQAKIIGLQKKKEYFARLPSLAAFLQNVINTASLRGYVFNWAGRVLQYDRNTSYKAPNGLIQSGVADMTKIALVRLSELFLGKRSKMLVQIYDAILFELDPCELDLIEPINKIMESIYPYKVLPMKVDGGFSITNWSELEKEIPKLATRERLSETSSKKTSFDPTFMDFKS